MLDMERIRDDPGELKRMLASRFADTDAADSLLKQDALRHKLAADSRAKKELRNRMSQKVGALKQEGASGETLAVMMNEMRALGAEIAVMDVDIAELDDKIDAFLLSAPNYPHASVPVGRNAKGNEEVYHRGINNPFPWEPKPYWNIGSALRILNFDDTAKLKGTQFTVYRDLGAQLERAVISFFLDTHIGSGYREVMMPYTLLSDENADVRQQPILDEDGGGTEARMPSEPDSSVIRLYRDTVLDEAELPVRHCAFSASFRTDITSTGTDSGGLLQRRFDTVELAAICNPERSYDMLSEMLGQEQKVLKLLDLPYRVMLRCTGMMKYSAAKTYDLEVWMPGYGRFVGVSDCSNCEDYLARRLNIRCRTGEGAELQLCHTLSGSGMAIGRTVAAILENRQNEDGSVTVPEALRDYMHTDIIR
ncbi:MAG: serine--tRNA ligase [Clostridiales bacterium]|nr:serine--tRNA ligase [Clostridiales bacterium]